MGTGIPLCAQTGGRVRESRRSVRGVIHVVVACVALGVMLVPSTASADPVVGKGCKSRTIKQKYQVVPGATGYGLEMSFRFCWTTGGSSSRIYKISGDTSAWANGVYRTQNDKGPTNSTKVPIS